MGAAVSNAVVEHIVERVVAQLRPELDAIRQLVERAPAPSESAEPTGPLLTREELAATLRLSEATLKRWDKDGCPRINLGDRIPRYQLAAVLAWRKQARERGPAAKGAPSKVSNIRILSRGKR